MIEPMGEHCTGRLHTTYFTRPAFADASSSASGRRPNGTRWAETFRYFTCMREQRIAQFLRQHPRAAELVCEAFSSVVQVADRNEAMAAYRQGAAAVSQAKVLGWACMSLESPLGSPCPLRKLYARSKAKKKKKKNRKPEHCEETEKAV